MGHIRPRKDIFKQKKEQENVIISNYTKIKSKRLSKYLYSLGFDRDSKHEDGNEIWLYRKSEALNEALDFYFYFRNKMKQLQENKVNEQRKIYDISKDTHRSQM